VAEVRTGAGTDLQDAAREAGQQAAAAVGETERLGSLGLTRVETRARRFGRTLDDIDDERFIAAWVDVALAVAEQHGLALERRGDPRRPRALTSAREEVAVALQVQRPALIGGDALVQTLPALAVAIDVTVLEHQPRPLG